MKQRAFYIWMVPGSAVLIAAFALVLASKTRRPIPAEATSNHIDQLFSRWDRRDSPGAAVAVVMEGTIVYMRGYGMADLQHSVSITPAIPFDIASLSKQFTAMSIAMLAERGRLALDDDIRSYLPEIPDFGRPITIRHLVHHTSGLRDWVEALEIAGWRPGDPISTTEILRMVERQRELNFEPGTQHLYSNTGYALLATIVERVIGESFDKWLESEIFQPLAMTSTRLPGGPDDPIRRSVRSYEGDGVGGFQYRPANIIAPGASSVHSTVEDLTKWILNFESCRVGGIAVMERMRETGVLNNGERIGYGFGHSIGVYRGVGFVGHGGQWG